MADDYELFLLFQLYENIYRTLLQHISIKETVHIIIVVLFSSVACLIQDSTLEI